MKVYFFAVLLLVSITGHGQSPKVPTKMQFAGMKLRITESARKEIQADVDALTKYPKYFNIKVEKAKSYFPIIERIFREENLPDDFKYLVLQESALIPDAVSSSNAVGFWQFKDFTAVEVGLKINRNVDERMNIVSSSRGAARYLKKNNRAFFDNWLHSLQAYQSGAGAALKVLDKRHKGASSMIIDKKTYWYVKKYLAHKVAFEGATSGTGQIQLTEYYDGANKSLKEISKETGVEEEELVAYNKWVRRGRVPADKSYAIIIPDMPGAYNVIATNSSPPPEKKNYSDPHDFKNESAFPKIKDEHEASIGGIVNINGLPGILASADDKIPALARKGKIDLSKFLKYNDLKIDSKLAEGQVYYLKKKRNKAKTHYHVVNYGETLWTISQKYGIRLKKLASKNRMTTREKLKPGRVLWLRYIRPAKTAIEYKKLSPKVVEEKVIVNNKESKPNNSKQSENERTVKEVNSPLIKPQEVEPPITHSEEKVVDTDVLDARLDSLNNLKNVEQQKIAEDGNSVVEKINDHGDPKNKNESNDTISELTDNEESDKIEGEEKPFSKTTVKTHVITSGQTYYSVSKLYDVEVLQILKWNDLEISDKLSIGQELVIYQDNIVSDDEHSPSVNDEFSYHTVKEGEGLYGIARSYDVTIQEVMSWNEKENFDISVGEKLKIKKKAPMNE